MVGRGASAARRDHVKQDSEIVGSAAGQDEDVPSGVEVAAAVERKKYDTEGVEDPAGPQPDASRNAEVVDELAGGEDDEPALEQVDDGGGYGESSYREALED